VETFHGLEELKASLGRELGPGPWFEVDQARLDGFADVTEDHQWIHVDPERAASGPFGTTVAHGFLTLSLVPHLVGSLRTVEGVRMGINYGLERVRFPAAVRVGSRIRGRATMTGLTELGEGGVQMITRTTIEIEGSAKPACVADLVSRYYF
jgi:acyl dehydratase